MNLKVWTELDGGKFKSLPAKLVSKNSKGVFTIQYLSPTHKRTISGKRIYTYEDETYEITCESIIQQVESELEFGFEELSSSCGNFVKFDEDDDDQEDEDYVPGSSSSSSSDEDDESEDESTWSSDLDDDDAEAEEEPVTEEEYE
jgi:hypothetical protein